MIGKKGYKQVQMDIESYGSKGGKESDWGGDKVQSPDVNPSPSSVRA